MPGRHDSVTSYKNPKKKFFKPKKPVNKMTEEELEEFANFVFDNLMGNIQNEDECDNTSR